MMSAYCCTLPTIVYDVCPLVAPASHNDLVRICHTAISKARSPTELGLPDQDLVREIYNWDEGLFCHLVNKMTKLAQPDDVLCILEMSTKKRGMYVLCSAIACDLEGDWYAPLPEDPTYYISLECSSQLALALERYAGALNSRPKDRYWD
jgi:hypothetical protein